MDTKGKAKSQNSSANWYDTNIREKERQRLDQLYLGRKQLVQISNMSEFLQQKVWYIRAIQEHTGGEMIEPEMLGHVLIPPNVKEFVFHRGYSFNLTSILNAGLIAGGRETRHTVLFTPFKVMEYTRRGRTLW